MLAEPSFDSLKVYQRLKSAKMEEKAASEIAKIFGDMLETQLATKRDIKELELRIELKIEQSKSELIRWMFGMFLGFATILLTAFKFLK